MDLGPLCKYFPFYMKMDCHMEVYCQYMLTVIDM